MPSIKDRIAKHVLEDVGVRNPEVTSQKSTAVVGRARLKNAASLDIDVIEIDPQHREHFDEADLQKLSNSIRDEGQLQPIRVRWDELREAYVLIAGERRLRAMKMAGLTAVDVVIAEGELTPKQILRQQIIENCQRSDLKPIERAKAFRQYMDEDGIDGQQLAEVLHVSKATVSNALKLLTLDEDTQEAVASGRLTAKAAIGGARTAQPKTRGRKQKPLRPKTYRTKAGRVIVEPKVNRSYLDALREALAAAEAAEEPLEKAA